MWKTVRAKIGGVESDAAQKGEDFTLTVAVEVGDKIEVDGNIFSVLSVEDYANRGELWIVKGQADGKSAARRANAPARAEAAQGSGDA
jgi:hypothetical protein